MLQARRGVEPLRAELLGHPVADTVGAPVAVVHGVAEQRARRVQQPIVDGPGVDADAGHRAGGAQAVEDAPIERQDVPVQGAGHAHRFVAEPVRLVQLQPAGLDAGRHDPATGRAQIHGGEMHGRAHHIVLMSGGPYSAEEGRGNSRVHRDVQPGRVRVRRR
ncbi:hypothetical protein GCM10027614_01790 [Micromonospora vulcania]